MQEQKGRPEKTIPRIVRDIIFGVLAGIVIEATTQYFRLEVLFPALPYIWFGILVFLTVDGLKKSKRTQDTLVGLYERLNKRQRMISYLVVAIIGAAVAEGYWLGIRNIFEIRAGKPVPIASGEVKPREEKAQSELAAAPSISTARGTATLDVKRSAAGTPATNKTTESSAKAPPEKPQTVQGFHEKLPKELCFSLGEHGITTCSSLKSLTEGKSTLIQLGGFVPVKFHIENGVIYCDVTIWGGPAGPPIELIHNEFTVKPPNWDRNFSANALEVVDDRGEPIFQLIRKTPAHYVMNGLMPVPGGGFILATPNEARGTASPIMPSGTLKPIFRYPSWNYPGQYAE